MIFEYGKLTKVDAERFRTMKTEYMKCLGSDSIAVDSEASFR